MQNLISYLPVPQWQYLLPTKYLKRKCVLSAELAYKMTYVFCKVHYKNEKQKNVSILIIHLRGVRVLIMKNSSFKCQNYNTQVIFAMHLFQKEMTRSYCLQCLFLLNHESLQFQYLFYKTMNTEKKKILLMTFA